MTLTTIDPTPALIVVDLQNGIVALPGVQPLDEVIENAARLATAFRRHGLPVVLVNATGRAPGRTDSDGASGAATAMLARPTEPGQVDPAAILEAMHPQPSDVRVTKQRWGAFHGTALDDELRARGVTQVVVVGVATSAGVESTARAAHEHGYNVVLATDAMTDRDAAVHEHSVTKIFPRLGETATTAEVLATLDQR